MSAAGGFDPGRRDRQRRGILAGVADFFPALASVLLWPDRWLCRQPCPAWSACSSVRELRIWRPSVCPMPAWCLSIWLLRLILRLAVFRFGGFGLGGLRFGGLGLLALGLGGGFRLRGRWFLVGEFGRRFQRSAGFGFRRVRLCRFRFGGVDFGSVGFGGVGAGGVWADAGNPVVIARPTDRANDRPIDRAVDRNSGGAGRAGSRRSFAANHSIAQALGLFD